MYASCVMVGGEHILTDILTASELRAVKGGGWRRRRWRVEAVDEEELEWEEVEGGMWKRGSTILDSSRLDIYLNIIKL